jgi:apolipoprotein N-acyltransferase
MPQVASLVWLAAGAALFGVVTRVAIPPFTWLALTFLIHASRSMPAVSGTALVWSALFIALAFGDRGILPIAGPGYFAVVAATAMTVAVPFALDRFAVARLAGLRGTLVFPMAFVAAEFLRSRFAPGATWGAIAYTQYGYLALMQVAALVGMWGLTFLPAWFASTFELAWRRGFAAGDVRTPVMTCAIALGAALLCGAVRLALAPTDGASLRVATLRVATLNRPTDLFIPGEITRIAEGSVSAADRDRLNAKLTKLHRWFLEGSRREARAGARVVVWPETSLLIFKEDESAFLAQAQRVAADEHVVLAMGIGAVTLGAALPMENTLVLIDPSGEIKVSYLKSHAVTGWEESIMRVGDGRLPVAATARGRIAGAICYDADFPEFIRQAALAPADLLVLPVNDWKEVKDIHFQMHAFRAIETGLPLVRAAASGLSSAFDPWGRVLGVADFYAEGDRTLTVQVPIGGVRTLYARTGDLFAWLCVAGVVLALGSAVLWV